MGETFAEFEKESEETMSRMSEMHIMVNEYKEKRLKRFAKLIQQEMGNQKVFSDIDIKIIINRVLEKELADSECN